MKNGREQHDDRASMSFGLLLFCIGLILMIAYLFVMDIF